MTLSMTTSMTMRASTIMRITSIAIHPSPFPIGNPLLDGSFAINWDVLDYLPDPNNWSEGRFSELANIAASVQSDLETVSLDLCSSLREATGERNLALVGGVALNSVMNAKVLGCAGFDQVFVPPAPGDEGIAVGCAMYGLQVMDGLMG